MALLWDLNLVFFGVMLGAILTSMVGRWVYLVTETLKSSTPHPKRVAVLVSLFHAGPWMLAAVGIFAYFQYSEPWAPFLGIGVLVWFGIFAFFMGRIRASKRVREKRSVADDSSA